MNIIKCYVVKYITNPVSEGNSEFYDIRRMLGESGSEPAPWTPTKDEEDIDLEAPDDPKIIDDLPRNTIIGIPVGPDEQVEDAGDYVICRPFFSSHFSLPVKKGEMVWVFSETGWEDVGDKWDTDGPCFWISRVHGSLISEDTNYTHYDREYEKINLSITSDDAGKDPGKSMVENYSPGYSVHTFESNEGKRLVNDLCTTWDEDEAVPRYTKREGDLVIQGSNNTLISLGTSIESVSDASNSKEVAYEPEDELNEKTARVGYGDTFGEKYGGAIDIVVGRGTGPEYLPDGLGSSYLGYPVRGQASAVLNSAGVEEVNKNPTQMQTGEAKALHHPRTYNPNEGWPDLVYDASRVYLARNADIDLDLDIPVLHANTFYPDGNPEEGKESGNTDKIDDISSMYFEDSGPAIAVKSKNIRIVARSIEAEEREVHADSKTPIKLLGEQGSIVLLKEGVLDPPYDPEADPKPIAEHASKKGNGRAVIALGADGTIYIDGPRIVIGSGQDKDIDHGFGEQIILGLGAEEPVVMGTSLNVTLDLFMAEVKNFIENTFANHSHQTGTGAAGIPGTGSDPSTASDVSSHAEAISENIANLDLHLSKVGKTK